MLVVFPPIFVADTRIIYGYNFVAPLKNFKKPCLLIRYVHVQSQQWEHQDKIRGLF